MTGSGKPARPFFDDDEIERLLWEEARIEQPFAVSVHGRYGIFVGCLVACILIGGVEQAWLFGHANDERVRNLPNGTQVTTALITLVAAFFAFYQWADARREASLERFYERLKLTNDRYAEWQHARTLVEHFWDESAHERGNHAVKADFERRMYAFLELDNLEYMVIRWQRGFARPLLMGRAMRLFASRCVSRDFRELALKLAKGSGYMTETSKLADVLAKLAEKEASAHAVERN